MQFSLKKNKEASVQPLVPAWHPNFRNYARLPDTKVVRTAFFVNAAAVSVALSAFLLFAYREYNLRAVNNQIGAWEDQIQADRGESNAAIALYRRFQAEEKTILEVDAFMRARIALSDFLLRLGQTLPPEISVTSLEFRDTGVIVRGTVRGAPDRASGQATAYVEQWRKDVVFGPLFDDVSLTNVNRDPRTGELLIELAAKFKADAGAKQ